MARGIKNRVNLNCAECNISFEIIKCRENKSLRHFCSASCRNIACGRAKRLNKYPKVIGICQQCKGAIVANYMAMDKPTRKFCSFACATTFRNLTDNPTWRADVRVKLSQPRPNGHYEWSEDRRIKWAESLKGDKCHFWRGGLTDENRGHRNSVYYALWREKVFERDNWTCQICNVRGGVILNADHIKPWSKFPELRFELSNGRTLCLDCHKQTDTFGGKVNTQAHL